VITDFHANERDKIDLRGLGVTFADLAIGHTGKHTTVVTIGADTITLNNVDPSSVHQSDFLI
jgi:hypothetical protein